MQQQIKPGYLIDLDGTPRHYTELMKRYNLSRWGVYRRTEMRSDGKRYLRAPKVGRPGQSITPKLKPGYMLDELDGNKLKHFRDLMEAYNLTKAGVYQRSELRPDGKRYFRKPKRPGWPKGRKRAA